MDSFKSSLVPVFSTKEARPIKEHLNPEQWFVEQLRAYMQRQPRGVRTPECPDYAFLRAYAARPGSFPLSDSRVRHVASCNDCLPALLDLRSAKTTASLLRRRAAAIATLCAACLVAGFFSAQYWHRPRSNAASGPHAGQQASAVIERTLDLTDYATFRDAGGQKSQPPLNLPAALLHINLILPRFSEAGGYTVMVASDLDGTRRVACTTGIATAEVKQTKLGVTLDLRGAKPGDYFLLTELSGQNDFYSYPLKVQ